MAYMPGLKLLICLESPSGESLVRLLTPVGLLGFQPLAPWIRQCQSHCFLCWSYVVSVLELWVNHEKNINIFLCRLVQLFPWKPSKMAKVLSLTIWKNMLHGCPLKAANVCPERAYLQTREVLKDMTYKTPPSVKASLSRYTKTCFTGKFCSTNTAATALEQSWSMAIMSIRLEQSSTMVPLFTRSGCLFHPGARTVVTTRGSLASPGPHQGSQKCFLCSPTRKHSCMWDPKHLIKGFQP